MIPRSSRLLVAAASLWVPRGVRAEWKREWHAELWHRAEAGATERALLECARGAFRDAAWFRSSEYAPVDSLRDGFFMKPMRVELCLLLAALILCAWSGALSPLRPPYTDPDRLVRLQRTMHVLGGLDSAMEEMLVKHLTEQGVLERVATYRFTQGPLFGAGVSRNFFDVLGVTPALGRIFAENDLENVVVITDDLWRYRFRRDPSIVGRNIRLMRHEFTVIGVLPRNFWFSNERLWFYTPLPKSSRFYNVVGRMKAGSTIQSTEEEARTVARKVELNWMANALELVPVADDVRKQDALFAASMGSIGGAFGLLYLMIRRRGGFLYRMLLGGRLFTLLAALSAMWVALGRLTPGPRAPYSFLTLWFFLLISFAASCLVVRDHGARCLVCFGSLRLPTPIGIWSSPILDQPGTEYVCPRGHGTLYIAETRNAPDHWSEMDESWRDLFAGTRR
jgi:MacB-like protein